jgi:uncharacterized protein YrrD
MLEKLIETLNRPVICVDRGIKAGIVRDVILSSDKKEAVGLILGGRSLDKKLKVVLSEDILKMGRDAVIVDSTQCITQIEKSEFSSTGWLKAGNLIGRKVFSRAGGDLGIVGELLIDWDTFRLEGFELSDGLIEDIFKGKRQLPLIGMVEFGEEAVVVEKEAEEEMENHGRGIRNRFFGEK